METYRIYFVNFGYSYGDVFAAAEDAIRKMIECGFEAVVTDSKDNILAEYSPIRGLSSLKI